LKICKKKLILKILSLLKEVGGWVLGRMGGWFEEKVVLWIAYSNQSIW
jgi:hypothetical protein